MCDGPARWLPSPCIMEMAHISQRKAYDRSRNFGVPSASGLDAMRQTALAATCGLGPDTPIGELRRHHLQLATNQRGIPLLPRSLRSLALRLTATELLVAVAASSGLSACRGPVGPRSLASEQTQCADDQAHSTGPNVASVLGTLSVLLYRGKRNPWSLHAAACESPRRSSDADQKSVAVKRSAKANEDCVGSSKKIPLWFVASAGSCRGSNGVSSDQCRRQLLSTHMLVADARYTKFGIFDMLTLAICAIHDNVTEPSPVAANLHSRARPPP